MSTIIIASIFHYLVVFSSLRRRRQKSACSLQVAVSLPYIAYPLCKVGVSDTADGLWRVKPQCFTSWLRRRHGAVNDPYCIAAQSKCFLCIHNGTPIGSPSVSANAKGNWNPNAMRRTKCRRLCTCTGCCWWWSKSDELHCINWIGQLGLGFGLYVVLDRERVSVQGTVLASLRRECVQQSQVNPLLYSSWMGCWLHMACAYN
ncbi:hypothetical protein HDV62DRAFT_298165 [Trichoderma sp. SZMC 28011]